VSDARRTRRLTATRREEERVTALELFFDLVFVLAITQCTALMAGEPTWAGLGRGLAVLAVLWWSWVGYAWLTSVLDPEEGAVRIIVFAAMAALLIAALCVPQAFGDLGLTFAVAYGVFRAAHIGLFVIASSDDPSLRRSVLGLAAGTAVGVGLLTVASFFDGWVQGAIWVTAIVLDVAEPLLFGAEGWELEPTHFAERHGLIVLIALGESIVAIGVGASGHVDGGIIIAACIGMALAATLWWAYFDVVAVVASRRLASLPVGRMRNEMARDSYSLLHFPMVAGIVLIALGMKKTLAHVDEPLHAVAATALVGGAALYLLALVAFRLRNLRTLNRDRLVVAVVLLLFVPASADLEALATLAIVTAILCALTAYEVIRFADARAHIRNELLHGRTGSLETEDH
jgi:low temperature requirement protein LtrA